MSRRPKIDRDVLEEAYREATEVAAEMGRSGNYARASMWAVWKAVAEESSSAALNAFVQRYYAEIADWRELDSEQTAAIIEQLKQWKKRVGK